ncbi:ATP-binding cassette, subfamily B [Acetitomaculum ruminis DSM 5522]|uniref:ATP-binding cassette, subfamily B n=1 Tax=Acetitomaculum ruminis DSM 5522 TaxID=1120918 RepID=A0A1I1A9K7_9FIRM|nr:ABC transporter ATP-binding protein [Acetitomaculum ruminis]SFB34617.1 ATP-binding cassette, subfamily B [Acetitomaculum ruminis DSM 5522]
MLKWGMDRFEMTRDGAIGVLKGSLYSGLYYISLMFPMSLIYLFILDVLPALKGNVRVTFNILTYIFIMILSLAISGFFYYKQYNAVFFTIYGESAKKRLKLGEKLRKLPLSFFEQKDLSDLTNTILSDVNTLENLQSHVIPGLIGSIMCNIVVAVMLILWDFRMGLAMFWVLPVVIINTVLSGKLQEKYANKHFLKKCAVADEAQEYIEHVSDIVAFNREEKFFEKYKKTVKEEESAHQILELVMSIFASGGQAFLKVGFAVTVIVGAILFEKGDLSLIKFLFYIISSARIYDPLGMVLNSIGYFYIIKKPVKRMKQIEETKEMGGKSDFVLENYNIVFENVDFGYSNEKKVLKNLSFKAKQGEVTALIGPSGCGKSTCTKLLTRFYDPLKGKIFIGGKNITKINPETLMGYISMVFQDVILFDNTVMENIRLGKRNASDVEVIKAAKMANCHEFIMNMTEGYQTMLGENGARLSGGERLRISIARAILKDAPILLLDEATASLDVENETKIQESIAHLIKGKTVVMIAHRMRTVENADHIIAIKDGAVVEEGSPYELLKKEGMFYQMLSLQKEETGF